MAMYAIGTKPFINKLNGIAKQVWYADDSGAGSTLLNLRKWWNLLNKSGPHYGYFPNRVKTHLLVKKEHIESANEVFADTGITITTEGKDYLGGAIGYTPFIKQFM